MRAISLFSGAGGIDLGMERAGIRTVLQAEMDPWCLQVLERHWPDVERLTDVRQVDASALQGRRGDVVGNRARADDQWLGGAARGAAGADLIYGGFPCQDVSVAGNRAGLGGARSGLWSEFQRVLRELRPRWCLVENVPGLLSSNRGHDFGTILHGLDELGYGVAWRILDARYFGVPQRRRRVFIVGCLGGPIRAAQVLAVCAGCSGHPAPSREEREGAAESFIGSAASPGEARALTARASGYRLDFETENFVVAATLNGGKVDDTSPALVGGDGPHGRSTFNGMDVVIAQTLSSSHAKTTASGGSHGTQAPVNVVTSTAGVRRLTPRECERLMSWPDGWTEFTADGRLIPDSHRYKMCGNGVVSTVAEWIGHRIVKVDAFLSGSGL